MVKAITLITVAPGKLEEVEKRIKIVEGVKDSFTVTGRADIVVYFEGSYEEICRIVKELGGIEGVNTTETLIEVS